MLAEVKAMVKGKANEKSLAEVQAEFVPEMQAKVLANPLDRGEIERQLNSYRT